jgi:NAD(P)H dehydrogenase (quinone)
MESKMILTLGQEWLPSCHHENCCLVTVMEPQGCGATMRRILTRFEREASQMSNFWDQAGSVWAQGQLTGKVGSVMSSTAAQRGGQETTLFSGTMDRETADALD